MGLTVDSTNGMAVLSFEDDHGDAVPVPAGATSTATSSDTAVMTVGAATAGTDSAGNSVTNFKLTPVAAGTTTLSVTTTGANKSDGSAIADPAPVQVTVSPGAAAEEVFKVTGS